MYIRAKRGDTILAMPKWQETHVSWLAFGHFFFWNRFFSPIGILLYSESQRISSLLPRFQSKQDNGRADRTSASIPYSHENPRQRPNYCFSRCIKKPGGK